MAPIPGHPYLHELLFIDFERRDVSSHWSGTSAAARELGFALDAQVDPAPLIAAHDVFGRFVELHFGAPASVSAAWGLGDGDLRVQLLEAHLAAVDVALAHLGLAIGAVPIVAHFPHTIARLPQPDGTPPPQLHTHVLVVAVDMDQPHEDLVTIGRPEDVPAATARLGYVPDGLEAIAGTLDERYGSALSAGVEKLGFSTDRRGEIPEVAQRLNRPDDWLARPCGIGSPRQAVAF